MDQALLSSAIEGFWRSNLPVRCRKETVDNRVIIIIIFWAHLERIDFDRGGLFCTALITRRRKKNCNILRVKWRALAGWFWSTRFATTNPFWIWMLLAGQLKNLVSAVKQMNLWTIFLGFSVEKKARCS